MRTILHVDMDAFFASVEQLDHPQWRGRPVIVGSGPHERGVVSTCSYEARRFGVRSAMPSRTAFQRCPEGVFVRPRMHRYREVSDAAFEVFSHYSPFVEAVSVDEAFLDITGTLHLYGNDAARLGEALRAEIRRTCGVTCSVGIAPNRLLAKIGSERHKPDGLTVMPFSPEEIAALLRPERLGVLWGVGKKTEEALRPYGILTCGDVQRLCDGPGEPNGRLRALVGDNAADTLAAYAFGICSDEVSGEPAEEKSVSAEYTFPEDEYDRGRLRAQLLELVDEVGRRFRRERRWAMTARLKLRDTAFNTITRQRKFDAPARDDMTFREAALALLAAEKTRGVRLVGFGVADLRQSPDDGAPSLFADPADARRERRERLSSAIDSLRDRGFDCQSASLRTEDGSATSVGAFLRNAPLE